VRPLDPLPTLETALRGAPASAVSALLDALDAERSSPRERAALEFGRGALALRDGRSDAAREAFKCAAEGFEADGELEAAHLAWCEEWLARVRRGAIPAELGGAGERFAAARSALAALAAAPITDRVGVVAHHYLGTAERAAGNLEATQRTLLEALAHSEGFIPERAQILNSLGTAYVLTGAYGAATSMLEHAADLARRLGDVVGEAIAFGQLGSAALARGEREVARRHLQRQEWLAARVGDVFGRSRALVLLGELALELSRPDEAHAIADEAFALATSVDPPLGVWAAQSARIRGRALLELGDRTGVDFLTDAAKRFAAVGNRLGGALVAWDRSRHGLADDWDAAAWELASLGLEQRLASLLIERRAASDDPWLDAAIASATQPFEHLSAAHELELLHRRPSALAAEAARRVRAQRSLARLSALVLVPPGLVVAVLAHRSLGAETSTVPDETGQAVVIGGLPSLGVWAWRGDVPDEALARELANLRREIPEIRVVVRRFADGRVAGPSLRGEPCASLEGVDLAPLYAESFGATPGSLVVLGEPGPFEAVRRAWPAPLPS
jgi:tetratricopeptide (TPR) repeat protein